MKWHHWRPYLCATLLAIIIASCEKRNTAPQSANSGAEDVAKKFFNGLRTQDWSAAYATLDSASRARCSKEHFANLGKQFLNEMELQPTEVSVSATESGDNATAIAVFRGVSGNTMKQFKDGASLHRTPDGWAVSLRSNFGKSFRRK